MKAKRKLSDFNFKEKGCHISLVGPSQGGPANGVNTLVLKSVAPKEGKKVKAEKKAALEAMITKAVAEKVADYKSKADALEKENEDLKADKDKEAKKVKKAKLVEAVGTERAEAIFKSLKDLSGDEFEVVLKGFKDSAKKEANGKMFKEQGVDGTADAQKVQDDASNNATAKYLKSKYAPKQ